MSEKWRREHPEEERRAQKLRDARRRLYHNEQRRERRWRFKLRDLARYKSYLDEEVINQLSIVTQKTHDNPYFVVIDRNGKRYKETLNTKLPVWKT